jgi:hypothetical protein
MEKEFDEKLKQAQREENYGKITLLFYDLKHMRKINNKKKSFK